MPNAAIAIATTGTSAAKMVDLKSISSARPHYPIPLYTEQRDGHRYLGSDQVINQVASRRRLLIGAVAVAAVVLIGIFGLTKLDLAPEHHLDGQGPLGSFGDTNSAVSMGFDPALGGPTWSAGLELCFARGDQPAVLDGKVGPAKIVGSGFQYLGAFVRRFPIGGGNPIGGIAGFPPPAPWASSLRAVTGFVVDNRCQNPVVDKSIPYTELVLGFSRTSDPSGGGWLGVDVGYNAGFRHHVVSLNYNFLICGPAAPQQFCAAPSTPTPSS